MNEAKYVAYVSTYTSGNKSKYGIRIYDVDMKNGRLSPRPRPGGSYPPRAGQGRPRFPRFPGSAWWPVRRSGAYRWSPRVRPRRLRALRKRF